MRLSFCSAALALCVLAGTARADQLVANGGFESGDFDSWTTTAASSGSLFFVDTSPNTGQFNASFGGTRSGSYDSISQTLQTVAGNTYTLSFALLQNGSVEDDADFEVFWNGLLVDDLHGLAGLGYNQYSYALTGTGNDVLSFKSFDVPSYYYLDDVSVSGNVAATPEPSSLMLLGTGALSFSAMVRRRYRRA